MAESAKHIEDSKMEDAKDDIEEYAEVEDVGDEDEEDAEEGEEDAEEGEEDAEEGVECARQNMLQFYTILKSRGENVEDLHRRLEKEFEEEEYFDAVDRELIELGRGLPSSLPEYFTSLEAFKDDIHHRCHRLLSQALEERACLYWKAFTYKGVPGWKMDYCAFVLNKIMECNQHLENQTGMQLYMNYPNIKPRNANLHHLENFLAPSVSWVLDRKHCASTLEIGGIEESFVWPEQPPADVLAKRALGVPDSEVTKLLTGVFSFTHLTSSVTAISSVQSEVLQGNLLEAWKPRAEADPRFAKVVEQVKTRVETAYDVQAFLRVNLGSLRYQVSHLIYVTKDSQELLKQLSSLLIFSGPKWRSLVEGLDNAFKEHLKYQTPRLPEVDPRTGKLSLGIVDPEKPRTPFESEEQREHVALGLRAFLAFGLQVVCEGRHLLRLRQEGPPSIWDYRTMKPIEDLPKTVAQNNGGPNGFRWGIGGPGFMPHEGLGCAGSKKDIEMIGDMFDDFQEGLLQAFVAYENNLSGISREDLTVLFTYMPLLYADEEEFRKLVKYLPRNAALNRTIYSTIEASSGKENQQGDQDVRSADFGNENDFRDSAAMASALADRGTRISGVEDEQVKATKGELEKDMLSSLGASSKKTSSSVVKDFKMASGIQEYDADQTLFFDAETCIKSFAEKQGSQPRPADLEHGCSACTIM
ncbi:unnamed protein product [Amoebophrya sp. A25]|nr:unnamed protein product [Amoebophrya sp. A25]|eukprot:GSA25T00000748001.1